MLEPWIIEQIRRREEEERRRQEQRPQLELPITQEPWPPRREKQDRHEMPDRERWDRQDNGDQDERERDQNDDEPKRGVVIIGL